MNRRDLFRSLCACAASPVVVDAPAVAKVTCFEFEFFDGAAGALVELSKTYAALGVDVPEEHLDHAKVRDDMITRYREVLPK